MVCESVFAHAVNSCPVATQLDCYTICVETSKFPGLQLDRNISKQLCTIFGTYKLKNMITGMHCDTKAIERAAQAIGMINSICSNLRKGS